MKQYDARTGKIVDYDPPEPTDDPHEWIDRNRFLDVLIALIPPDDRDAVVSRWETLYFALQLPPDAVDLLDPRVTEFFNLCGLTADMFRAALEAAPNDRL